MEEGNLPKKKGWFGRNWKWFIPLSCSGITLLGIGGCATFVFAIFSFIKSSGAYELGLKTAKNDSQVIKSLGQPIEEGWYVSGNVQINNQTGHADITFPISGPKGEGIVHCKATRQSGKWQLQRLSVALKNGAKTVHIIPKVK